VWSFCFPGSFGSPQVFVVIKNGMQLLAWPHFGSDGEICMHCVRIVTPSFIGLVTPGLLAEQCSINQGLWVCHSMPAGGGSKLNYKPAFYTATTCRVPLCVGNNIIKLHSPAALWLMTKDPTLLWLLWKASIISMHARLSLFKLINNCLFCLGDN